MTALETEEKAEPEDGAKDDDEDDESPTKDDFKAWSTGKNIKGKQFEEDIPNATNQAMLATNLCLSLSLVRGTKAYDQTIFLDCVEQLHTPNWSVVRMERGFGGVGTVLDHKLLSLNSFRYQTVQPKRFAASNSLTEQFDASNC